MTMSQQTFAVQPNPQHNLSLVEPTANEQHCIAMQQISMSQLLGRDYLFIDTRANKGTFTTRSQVLTAIEDLVMQLVLSDSHSLFIGIHEDSSNNVIFVRHEISWQNHKIIKLETMPITHQEQQDFMTMIWHCSTPIEV